MAAISNNENKRNGEMAIGISGGVIISGGESENGGSVAWRCHQLRAVLYGAALQHRRHAAASQRNKMPAESE
jgi:hypothetical protein